MSLVYKTVKQLSDELDQIIRRCALLKIEQNDYVNQDEIGTVARELNTDTIDIIPCDIFGKPNGIFDNGTSKAPTVPTERN